MLLYIDQISLWIIPYQMVYLQQILLNQDQGRVSSPHLAYWQLGRPSGKSPKSPKINNWLFRSQICRPN